MSQHREHEPATEEPEIVEPWQPDPEQQVVEYQAPPAPPPPPTRTLSDVERNFKQIFGYYLWRLVPAMFGYALLVQVLPEQFLVLAHLGFWPVMLLFVLAIHLWRRRQAGTPSRPPRAPVWDRYDPDNPGNQHPQP